MGLATLESRLVRFRFQLFSAKGDEREKNADAAVITDQPIRENQPHPQSMWEAAWQVAQDDGRAA
jgi:hypothetical protein